LGPDYAAALAAHLDAQSEGSLRRAYELGRQALAAELGILDTLSLYEAAFRELVLRAPSAEQSPLTDAVTNFFRELLSPFEMTFRGYREANNQLRRLNEELTAANAQLQANQVQLIQSTKMASLGELVAGIAHEINNPLAYVLSHLRTSDAALARLEAALEPELSAETSALLERAHERITQSEAGAERIRDLVLKLRTFSRLDEGEQKMVSVRESVLSVLTILEHRCKDRISIQTSFGEPDLVECFPGLLNQAVMNLVANAIDAIPGTGTISIATGGADGWYAISVTDTGSGIPEHLRERVVEPFFTTKPVGQGTGLGLSITHSIVQRHAGTLELGPGANGGTVATIRFPYSKASKPPSTSARNTVPGRGTS
jgi:two-component system NtrC family sensor kinase